MHPEDNLLVLCRHGQSLTNASNVFTGILDPPLTAHGEVEARDVGRFLAELPGGEPMFDVCFTSPLVRASRSAGIILETLGQAPLTVVEDALVERDYGLLNGRSKAQVANEFGEAQTEAWRRGYEDCPPGGESLRMCADRAMAFFDRSVRPRLMRGEKILLVTSGNTARGMVMRLEGLNPHEIRSLQLGTAATRLYTFSGTGRVKDRVVNLNEDGQEGGH